MSVTSNIENQTEIQTEIRILNDAELDAVEGGTVVYAIGRIEPRFPRLSGGE